ncbi:MAG: dienelactone hydrolase family protein [Candidatus Hydrogenedentes bacterium]|nr:dienelactone hydrolase family protein [Candidatus Hydrogenedentota bacterium]
MLLRRIALVIAVAVLVVLVIGIMAKQIADARFYEGYDPQAPLSVTIRAVTEKPDYELYDLAFDGLPGMAVPTLLALPLEGPGPHPCVIFLHGIGQDKDFLEVIAAPFTKAGFAFVSFDQYTRGERKRNDSNPLKDALGLRRRSALNVIETRRLVDYLVTRPEIAPDRIYLVGASFGAITGATAVAFEPRIPAAVMTYGGGDLDKLLSSDGAKAELGKAHWLVKTLVTYMMSPADPVKYVGQVAPRPLLFQNGTHDQLIPNAAADAFFEAANEPKERTLYDSDHVGLDEENTRTVLNECLTWLQGIDAKKTGTASPGESGSTATE